MTKFRANDPAMWVFNACVHYCSVGGHLWRCGAKTGEARRTEHSTYALAKEGDPMRMHLCEYRGPDGLIKFIKVCEYHS